jgi:hypothetical protein
MYHSLKGTILYPKGLSCVMQEDQAGRRQQMAKAKDTSHLRVRIDPARLARLEKSAEKNGRTLTGEIIYRLDESFKRDDFTDALERLSEKMTVKIGNMIIKQGRRVPDGEQR